ncbi:hypothetical protein [Brevibacillus dissolubilis]|uniref:hypothetical protein n=1 Tax=Brevibacillus dissolubilis TaxID=1844116 RepID=UPI0011169573|nr:hypothetical protein [Brevibacillus dissolubilis]
MKYILTMFLMFFATPEMMTETTMDNPKGIKMQSVSAEELLLTETERGTLSAEKETFPVVETSTESESITPKEATPNEDAPQEASPKEVTLQEASPKEVTLQVVPTKSFCDQRMAW